MTEHGEEKVQYQSDADRLEEVSNKINALVVEQVRQLYPMFARFGIQWIQIYDAMITDMRHSAWRVLDLKRVMLLNERDLHTREDIPMKEEALTE